MENVVPEASAETKALNAAIDNQPAENRDPEDEAKEAKEAKPERTPEEREHLRQERKISRLLQQRADLRAKLAGLTPAQEEAHNQEEQSDNEKLSLSRKELSELVDKEARKLAPTLKQQETEIEHRRSVVARLAKEWGQEKFDSYASDLDDAFDGLADADKKPKPAVDAIFESPDPASLIAYLADPDHADEAEAIARMTATQAGRAITKLEDKLAAKRAEAKPQESKVPAPIEAIRGDGKVNTKRLRDLSDDDFTKRRKEQIAKRR